MNILKNRKFRFLLACLSLFFLLNMIQDTYAKYISSAEANSNFSIAKWSFLINNQDVLSNNDFSNIIVPVFDENIHIKSGVISPTSTGYFDVTINSSNVDVSFDEEITLTNGSDNTVTDLIFTGYKLNDNEIVNLDSNSPTITTTHLLNEEKKVNTYRFFIKWLDGTGENMNNENDTNASLNGNASIKINVRFIQKAN